MHFHWMGFLLPLKLWVIVKIVVIVKIIVCGRYLVLKKGLLNRMEYTGLTRSMSEKGCSPDNAACEGFFGRLKNEIFYNRSWQGVSVKEFIAILNDYLIWYREKRIKLSLGGLSPMEYRRSLGLI